MQLTVWKFIRAFALALVAVAGFSLLFDGEFPFSIPILLISAVALILSSYQVKNQNDVNTGKNNS